MDKLDFDALYDDAEAAGRFWECPLCAEEGDYEPKALCWCGVCLKYHHNDFFHEVPLDDVYFAATWPVDTTQYQEDE
jgi:hypothetical protein